MEIRIVLSRVEGIRRTRTRPIPDGKVKHTVLGIELDTDPVMSPTGPGEDDLFAILVQGGEAVFMENGIWRAGFPNQCRVT